MAGYVSPPPLHPLGQHRPKFEKLRREKGLTPAGFKEDGSDLAKAEKVEMERAMYERADARLPPGIVIAPADAGDTDN